MRRFGMAVAVAIGLMSAHAEAAGPGAVFLMIFPDARTAALGGCGTAMTDLDANTYYNPAGIAFGPRAAATYTGVNWLPGLYPGMGYDHLGVAYRFGERLGVAANVIYLTTGTTDVVNERGEFLGRYRTWDAAPSITGAYRFPSWLSSGMTLKLIHSFLVPGWVWEEMPELGIECGGQATTFAVDGGVQCRLFDLLSVGVALNNLGPRLDYYRDDTIPGDRLPTILRLGYSLSPRIPGPVEVTLVADVWRDLVTPMWHSPYFVDTWEQMQDGIGLELRFAKLASVGLGYFEDIMGQRGGIVVEDSMGFTHHISLLRHLDNPHLGRIVGWGFCWGVGVEYNGLKFDVGVDENIYDFPTRNVRFQLSGRI